MRSLGKIFIYAFAVLLVGALVAPLAWHLIQMLPSGWLGGFVGGVQRMPFHRYLSRSIQVTAIVLLWPLLRSLHIRSIRELGLSRNPCPGRDLSAGLVAGLAGAFLLQPLLLWSGAYELHPGWSFSVLPRIVTSAVVVAFLEEWLFRGVVLGFCRQFLSPAMAIALSAILFAVLHFLNLPSAAGEGMFGPHWWSGIAALGAVGKTIPMWPYSFWAFLTLCAAGILLGWMTLRTGSLWAPIALHASWIFGQQIFNVVAGSQTPHLPLAGPAQCNGMVPIGLIPLFCILIAGLLVSVLLKRRPRPPRFPGHL